MVHLVWLLCLSTPASTSEVFGVTQGVYSIDINTGQTERVIPTPIIFYGATDGDDATSFFATNVSSLYRIDPFAQQLTVVGEYSRSSIYQLAYSSRHDVLFGTDYRRLYRINKDNGHEQLIGSFRDINVVFALDFADSLDKLLAVNRKDNALYEVDPLTAAVTLIGPVGFERVTDIWFDEQNEQLYGVSLTPEHTLIRIDIGTGRGELVAPIEPDLVGLGAVVPEPKTLVPLVPGLAVLAWRPGRRARSVRL